MSSPSPGELDARILAHICHTSMMISVCIPICRHWRVSSAPTLGHNALPRCSLFVCWFIARQLKRFKVVVIFQPFFRFFWYGTYQYSSGSLPTKAPGKEPPNILLFAVPSTLHSPRCRAPLYKCMSAILLLLIAPRKALGSRTRA